MLLAIRSYKTILLQLPYQVMCAVFLSDIAKLGTIMPVAAK